jgi:hypothetical protein
VEVIRLFLMQNSLKGKNNIAACEIGFLVTEDYVVMIDGVGTPSPMVFNGNKGGRYFMDLIKESIYTLEPNLNHIQFLDKINAFIVQDYKKNGWYESLLKDKNLRPMACVLVYSKYFHQLWFYGGCKALVAGEQIENPKFIDEVMANVQKLLLETKSLVGHPLDKVTEEYKEREFVEPLLEKQREFLHATDNPFGFSMVDGFDFIENSLKIVKLPKGLEFLVLSTDGYNTLKNNFEETEKLHLDYLESNQFEDNERAYIKIRF